MPKLKYFQPVIVFFFLLIPAFALSAETFRGNVIKVSDGDTIVVRPDEGGAFVKCRLYGIDAPEIDHGRKKPGQPYGEDAGKALKRLILGQDVEIQVMDRDRYKRSVCRVYKDKTDINLEMVREGFAWAYTQYLRRPHASEYLEAEKEARGKKLGLWVDLNPTPPWEFRKKMRTK